MHGFGVWNREGGAGLVSVSYWERDVAIWGSAIERAEQCPMTYRGLWVRVERQERGVNASKRGGDWGLGFRAAQAPFRGCLKCRNGAGNIGTSKTLTRLQALHRDLKSPHVQGRPWWGCQNIVGTKDAAVLGFWVWSVGCRVEGWGL